MVRRRKQKTFLCGTVAHRRTEGEYMGVLLDTVTLDDWRDVVAGALQAAKQGDPSARSWLAHYLIGRPEGKAPTPLTVIVQQLNGSDPLVDRLAKPLIERQKYPSLCRNDDFEASVKALITAELAEKMPNPKTAETQQRRGIPVNEEERRDKTR
jgi:hypothetical protein